jgi:hypothetical protein
MKVSLVRLSLKCDGTRAETRFRLQAKRTSPFKSAGASVQSTTGSRVVRISGSNVGYTMFPGSVKSTGYPLHLPVSPSFPLPCVIACHHISNAAYNTETAHSAHKVPLLIWLQHIQMGRIRGRVPKTGAHDKVDNNYSVQGYKAINVRLVYG